MNGSIIDNWLQWLKKYKGKDRDTAIRIHNKLIAVSTVENALALFSHFLKIPKKPSSPFFTHPLFAELQKWDQALSTTVTAINLAREKLANISLDDNKSHALVVFLQQLLANPQVGLHYQVNSLLNCINTAALEKLFSHLVSLEDVQANISPRTGDFAALTAVNSHHAQCLALLANNSAAYEENNTLSVQANTLLQRVLNIHKDIHSSSSKSYLALRESSVEDEQEAWDDFGMVECILL